MTDQNQSAEKLEVKNAVARAIEGTGNTVEETIDVTKGATVKVLRSVGNVGEAAAKASADILTGAIEAADDVGSELGNTVKGAIIGIIRGTAEVASVTVASLVSVVRSALTGTSSVGTDIGTIATETAHGAIVATKGITLSVQDAAFGVAQGLIVGTKNVGADIGLTAKKCHAREHHRCQGDRRRCHSGGEQHRPRSDKGNVGDWWRCRRGRGQRG